MSKKGGAALQKDAPWRQSSAKPLPKIHHSPILRLPNTPYSNYALSVTKHPNPVGSGLATDAIVEAAGPDCIVPGQIKPIRLLGLKNTEEQRFIAEFSFVLCSLFCTLRQEAFVPRIGYIPINFGTRSFCEIKTKRGT